LFLEYLPGREYTIDCFTDRKKGLLFCRGRERVRVVDGLCVDSVSIENVRFREIADIINDSIEMYGAWFFQLKEDLNGELTLLEIAPRISGSMSLYRTVGVNFPLLSLYESSGYKLEILVNPGVVRVDRGFVGRYEFYVEYDCVYVDYDDCLVLSDRVNLRMIEFLYQCVNRGKRIVLLTKHGGDIHDSLSRFRISSELFDEIIVVERDGRKRDHIDTFPSIFVDDSFSERKDVFDNLEIPTFDCSMIEILLNDKY